MSNIKTFFCLLFLFIHFIVIIIVSIYLSITSVCYVYNKELPKNAVFSGMTKVVGNPLMVAYGKYTGAEMGYGFFGPNVLSSGCILIKKNGKQCDFKLSNQENWVRYMCLCHVFVTAAVDDIKNRINFKKGKVKINKSSYVSSNKIKCANLDSVYNDLMLKGMGYRYLADSKQNDTLDIQLKVYEFTRLKDYKGPSQYNQKSFTIYEKKYFSNHKPLAQ